MYHANSPTELFYERHELLLREAQNARVARRLRARRRKGEPRPAPGSKTGGPLRRVVALWGQTVVPFFRA